MSLDFSVSGGTLVVCDDAWPVISCDGRQSEIFGVKLRSEGDNIELSEDINDVIIVINATVSGGLRGELASNQEIIDKMNRMARRVSIWGVAERGGCYVEIEEISIAQKIGMILFSPNLYELALAAKCHFRQINENAREISIKRSPLRSRKFIEARGLRIDKQTRGVSFKNRKMEKLTELEWQYLWFIIQRDVLKVNAMLLPTEGVNMMKRKDMIVYKIKGKLGGDFPLISDGAHGYRINVDLLE